MVGELSLKAHGKKIDSFSMVSGATASPTNTEIQVVNRFATAFKGDGPTDVDMDMNMEEWLR